MEDITMKKLYINPTIEIIKVTTQKMLAGSGTDRSITNSDAGTTGGYYDDAHGTDFDW